MTRSPSLTIAICTHDRPALLERALESVVGQVAAPDEILVVDNAPSRDVTRQLVRGRFPAVRYVAEPVPGLDFARNRALAEAHGDIVCFLDDDAVAAPDWADALRRNFADPRVLSLFELPTHMAGAPVMVGRYDLPSRRGVGWR